MQIMVEVLKDVRRNPDLSDLAVVFPAFNEERRVAEALETALRVGAARVVCVNDGSKDRTREILDGFRGRPKVDILHHEANQGKQAAIKHGLMKALEYPEVRRIATLDADMQDNPSTLDEMAAPVGDYDASIAYRHREEMPLVRRLANALANVPYRAIAGVNIHDLQAGYRVYTREVAQYVAENLAEAGGYTLEHTTLVMFGELARRWGRPFRLAEVPNSHPYDGAVSHIRIRDKLQLTCASVRYAWRLRKILRA